LTDSDKTAILGLEAVNGVRILTDLGTAFTADGDITL
jgi:hypothetical protein